MGSDLDTCCIYIFKFQIQPPTRFLDFLCHSSLNIRKCVYPFTLDLLCWLFVVFPSFWIDELKSADFEVGILFISVTLMWIDCVSQLV